jgi:hypothetical protein
VDGVQIGGTFTAVSQNGVGVDPVLVHGDWGPGKHLVQVSYLNDHFDPNAPWGSPERPSVAEDRDLYLDAATLNDKPILGAARVIYNDWGGYGTFEFSESGAGAGANLTPEQQAVVNGNPLLLAAQNAGVDVAPFIDAATDQSLAIGTPDLNTADAAPDRNNLPSGLSLTESGNIAPLIGFDQKWVESFDNGDLGRMTTQWGKLDKSVDGQITLHGSDGKSGFMVPANGPDTGDGYGLFTVTAEFASRLRGGYIAGWPASNKWPGPERDLVENINGQSYATNHYSAGGKDAYESVFFPEGFDPTVPHNYQLLWLPDSQSLLIDGVEVATWHKHLPKSFADGGENTSIGSGMDFADLSGPNALTTYEVSYATPGYATDEALAQAQRDAAALGIDPAALNPLG